MPQADAYTIATGKALLVFAFLGPMIGLFATGENVSSGIPWVLIPTYIFGGPIAVQSWLLYSLAMSALVRLGARSFIGLENKPPLLFALGAIVGATVGFAVFNAIACNSGRWLFGGWLGCFANSLNKFALLSLLPGGICGGVATFFFRKK